MTAAVIGPALAALCLIPSAAAIQSVSQETDAAAADQVLTWTSGNSLTEYTSAPETATAGPATIVFENSEATGNTSLITHTLTFDTATAGYNHDVDVNIVASPIDSNGGRWEVEVNLSPGKYRYFCDMPGHEQMAGVLVVTDGGGGGDDTTAPTVTAEVSGEQDADGNYVGSASVALAATDDGSGVDTVEYQIDDAGFEPYTDPVVVEEPGDHSVQYRATDKAGNTSELGSLTFAVVDDPGQGDTTPPQVSAELAGEQDADGNYTGPVTVTVSAQDGDSGVDTIEYNLDGAGYQPYTEPVVVDAKGEHTMVFRATDKAGNTSADGSAGFTIVDPGPGGDTTAPTVTVVLAGPQDFQWNYVGPVTVTLSAQDDGSGVGTIEYQLDASGYQPYTEPLTVEEPGEHAVLFRATDKAGNTSEFGTSTFTITGE